MFGLSDRTNHLLLTCLSNHEAVREVIIYGSRAKGNFKVGSDIDLTLKGENLNLKDVFHIEKLLDDLLLPYKFDISIYDKLSNPELLDHINRVGITLYKKA